MKEQLENLDKKVDKLDERLDKIDVHLAEYNTQLGIHIKRTEMLEKDVAPIKDHVSQVKGIVKFIPAAFAVGAAIATAAYHLTKIYS